MAVGTTRPMIEWKQQGDLFTLARGWLREDRELRRQKEVGSGRIRGPKTDVSSWIIFEVQLHNDLLTFLAPHAPKERLTCRHVTPRHSLKSTTTAAAPVPLSSSRAAAVACHEQARRSCSVVRHFALVSFQSIFIAQ